MQAEALTTGAWGVEQPFSHPVFLFSSVCYRSSVTDPVFQVSPVYASLCSCPCIATQNASPGTFQPSRVVDCVGNWLFHGCTSTVHEYAARSNTWETGMAIAKHIARCLVAFVRAANPHTYPKISHTCDIRTSLIAYTGLRSSWCTHTTSRAAQSFPLVFYHGVCGVCVVGRCCHSWYSVIIICPSHFCTGPRARCAW